MIVVIGALFLKFSLTVHAMDPSAADNLAQSLLTQSGRHCALIAVPHCGSGELAISFWNQAGDSRMIVDAFESDPTLLASAQQKANAVKLLGRNLYVRAGALSTNSYSMPYADHFCDLICATGLADTNFNNISYAEIERVLCTGAKAWVGRAAVEGAGLSATTLTNWINAAGMRTLSSATVVSDVNGTWAVITKISRLANTYEGDGGSAGGLTTAGGRFYNDKVATWPTLPQWFVKPYGTINNDGNAKNALFGYLTEISVGGGRMYGFDSSRLCAFRAQSGQLLWQMAGLSGEIRAFSQGVVYMPYPYTNSIVYDGETGVITNTFTLNTTAGTSPWSAVESNIFYAVLCKTNVNTLFAYNLTNGSALYSYPNFADNHVLPGAASTPVVMAGGKIYTYSGTSVYGYNASDGMKIWGPVTAPESITKIQASPQGVLIQSGATPANLYFLSVADGTRRWGPKASASRSGGYYDIIQSATTNDFNHGNEFVCPIGGSGPIDLLTGNAVGSVNYGPGACGPGASSTPAGTFSRRGGMEFSFAGAGGTVQGGGPYAGSCGDSPFAASGMTIYKNTCGCYGLFRGIKAEAPMGTFNPEQAPLESERLERGSAYTDLAMQVVPDVKDWPTHRANNNRSGSSPVKIATDNCVPLWKYTSPSSNTYLSSSDHFFTYHDITPPVTAGGYTYLAGSDGIVKCIKNDNGSNIWNYATGGWIFATPTIANGCVYVGSGDGYAYCLEAHTGRLVWRFRGAPAERRFNYYGHLISPWPILTGVLVHTNGLAYFVSGMLEGYGVQAYAVDARTGSLTNGWQNTGAGVYLDNRRGLARNGLVPGGYLTVIGSNLWVKETMHGYFNQVTKLQRMGMFDLQTGLISSNAMSLMPNCWTGRQIARMGNYVVGWGEDIHTEMQYEQYGGGVSFTPMDASGNPLGPLLAIGTRGNPSSSYNCFAWDDSTAYIEHNKCNLYDLTHYFDTTVSGLANSAIPASYPIAMPNSSVLPTDPLWRPVSVGGLYRATALTANCLIEVNSAGDIGVMDRTTGSQLFKVSSGGEPYLQSLAVDRSGKIIVANRNGDVVCYGTTNTVIVTQPIDVSGVAPGHAATFCVEAVGLISGGALRYQWWHNNQLITGATNASFTINEVSDSDAGGYYVVVTNGNGNSVPSATANLSLNVTAHITAPINGAIVAEPANISIRADASSAHGTITGLEIWQGANLLGSTTSTNFSLTWTNVAAGNYSLVAKAYDSQSATGFSGAVNVTVAGLVAHLPFDETSGTVAHDTSGHNNHGTLTNYPGSNSPNWTNSAFSGGVHFSGPNAVTVGVTALTNAALTVGFWMNSDMPWVSYYCRIFSFKDSGTNHSMLYSSNGSYSPVNLLWSTTTGTQLLSAAHNPLQGTWYHYAVVATPAEVDWYVNGSLFATLTPPIGQTMMTSYTNFVGGNGVNPSVDWYHGYGFPGIMDDLKIYDRALGAGEVMNLYTNVPYPRIPPTIGITSPANNTVINSTNCVVVTVNTTVTNAPLHVIYYHDGALIGVNYSAPYGLTWSNVPRGTYSITAVAVDGLNQSATSTPVQVQFAPVVAPTISLAGGTYATAQTVTFNCADSNALIYYTTDGSDPSPVYGTLYVPGFYVPINQSLVLKVRAFENGMYPSEILKVIYRVGGMLASGNYHSTVLRPDGAIWAWGYNSNGRLGDGTQNQRNAPVLLASLSNAVCIADGNSHSVALMCDGSVWAWGANNNGQVGDGTTSQRIAPVQVTGLSNVTAVAAGGAHSLALKGDGTVWAWGYNYYGQLGDGTTSQRTAPVQVSGLSNVVALAGGANHSLALKNDGTAWAWGSNSNGQLGDGTTTQRNAPVQVNAMINITNISAGGYNSVALKGDGTVWTWGYNGYGQLGDGSTTPLSTSPVQTSGLSNVLALATGYFHSLALKNDGTVWAWGYNTYGQLGNSTNANTNLPVAVSEVVQFIITNLPVTESTGSATIGARLFMATNQDVTVPFTLTGSTAGLVTNYSAITASPLVIKAGQTSTNITVNLINDAVYRGTPTIQVNMLLPTNALPGSITNSTLTILDDDPMPVVQFLTTSQSVVENVATATIGIQLSAPCGLAVSVPFTLTGTAVLGTDYTINASPLTIMAGLTITNLSITVSNRPNWQGDRTLIVKMSAPTNATPGNLTNHTVTIIDKDPQPVAIIVQPSDQAVNWGQAASFSVAATGAVPICYQWRKGGGNISGATNAVYITPSAVVADDRAVFSVMVSNAANSVTSSVANLTVQCNPSPLVSIQQPASGSQVTPPADLIINATANAGGLGSIQKVDFYNSGTLWLGRVTTLPANPYTLTLNNLASGTYNLTAVVTDNQGQTATSSVVQVTVTGSYQPSLNILTASELTTGTVGFAYNQSLIACGGTPGYMWSVISNGLPAGLGLVASSGAITGTPASACTTSFTARVTDAAGSNACRVFNLNVISAYGQWCVQQFGTTNAPSSNLLETPANDGIANLVKYALGIDPQTPGFQNHFSCGMTNRSGQNYFALTYIRPDPAPFGVSYSFDAANDLLVNAWTSATITVNTNINGDGTVTITVRDNASSSLSRYLRLLVIGSP